MQQNELEQMCQRKFEHIMKGCKQMGGDDPYFILAKHLNLAIPELMACSQGCNDFILIYKN